MAAANAKKAEVDEKVAVLNAALAVLSTCGTSTCDEGAGPRAPAGFPEPEDSNTGNTTRQARTIVDDTHRSYFIGSE